MCCQVPKAGQHRFAAIDLKPACGSRTSETQKGKNAAACSRNFTLSFLAVYASSHTTNSRDTTYKIYLKKNKTILLSPDAEQSDNLHHERWFSWHLQRLVLLLKINEILGLEGKKVSQKYSDIHYLQRHGSPLARIHRTNGQAAGKQLCGMGTRYGNGLVSKHHACSVLTR